MTRNDTTTVTARQRALLVRIMDAGPCSRNDVTSYSAVMTRALAALVEKGLITKRDDWLDVTGDGVLVATAARLDEKARPIPPRDGRTRARNKRLYLILQAFWDAGRLPGRGRPGSAR